MVLEASLLLTDVRRLQTSPSDQGSKIGKQLLEVAMESLLLLLLVLGAITGFFAFIASFIGLSSQMLVIGCVVFLFCSLLLEIATVRSRRTRRLS